MKNPLLPALLTLLLPARLTLLLPVRLALCFSIIFFAPSLFAQGSFTCELLFAKNDKAPAFEQLELQFTPTLKEALAEPVMNKRAWQHELSERLKRVANEELIKAELKDRALVTLKRVAQVFRERRGSESEAKTNAYNQEALQLILQNPYLEYQLPARLWKELVEKELSSTNTQVLMYQVLQKIKERRKLYVERNKLNPEYMNSEPFNWQEHFTLHEMNQFNIARPKESLSFADITKLLPRLDHSFPRDFSRNLVFNNISSVKASLPEGRRQPLVFVLEPSDVPGVRVVIFDDIINMNSVFYRASFFTEVEKRLISGHELFGIKSGGHDLTGTDLLTYAMEMEQNFSRHFHDHHGLILPEKSGSARLGTHNQRRMELRGSAHEVMDFHHYRPLSEREYEKRLTLEREFFQAEILPFIRERGADQVVYLALATDTLSKKTLTHEMAHARFFTNAEYQADILNYYHKVLTEAERLEFYQSVAWVGYNPNDGLLMANEFSAHMLQISDPLLASDSPQTKEIHRVIEKLKPDFLQYLKEKAWASQ